MRASARLSVRELSDFDLYIYGRVLPKKSLLLDCMALVDWELFATKLQAYYSSSGEGQPPYPPLILLKLELLGYLHGMGRKSVLERACSDLHWKYFLGLPVDAILPDHSTLSYFRQRIGVDGFKEIFDSLVAQSREHGLVSDRLRLKDATHIYADIAVPSALKLFSQLREQLLHAIKAINADEYQAFEAAVQLMREQSDGESPEVRLHSRVEIVKDIVAWIAEQNKPADKTKERAWKKLQELRALAEKILFDREHPESGDKTLSVHDPDARRGKHGDFYEGYFLDVMIDADSEIITSLNVLPANGDEAQDTITLVEAEEQAHGNNIEKISIDGIGFNGKALRTLTDEEGLDLGVFTPPRDFTTTEGFDSSKFELIDNGERVRCPAGEVSGKAGHKADKPNTSYFTFPRLACARCRLLPDCHPNFNPAGRTGRRVTKNEYDAEYAHARAIAQTEEYAAVRRQHHAIERKLNEFVRHHRSRRAMYRGLGRVKVQQLMTGFAINIKRIVTLLRQKCATTSQIGLA